LSTYETQSAATQNHERPAAEQVQQVAGAAQEKAQQAADQARSRLRDQADQRSTQAGQRVAGVASDARSVAEHLRSQGKDRPAELADQAAQRAERVGAYLKNADGDAILRDVERFGRERPWAVMAGGAVLGLAASRFLKASSARRYRETQRNAAAYAPVEPRPAPAPVTPGSGPAPGVPIPATPEPDRPVSAAGIAGRPPAPPSNR
jgi:ElaB/YqjD/DUF883 family membrane-anchored ribosome-binding protein